LGNALHFSKIAAEPQLPFGFASPPYQPERVYGTSFHSTPYNALRIPVMEEFKPSTIHKGPLPSTKALYHPQRKLLNFAEQNSTGKSGVEMANSESLSFMRKMTLLRSVIYEKSCWIPHIPLGFHI